MIINSSLWDKLHETHEFAKYPDEELIRFIARNYYHVPDRKQVKILELGCGGGSNLWFLANEGFSVYGIDWSRVSTARAVSRLQSMGLKAFVETGDACNLPYENEMFDCIIEIHCIAHNTISDGKKIVSEIKRVLKPDGRLFSKTPAHGTTPWKLDYGVTQYLYYDEILPLYGDLALESIDTIERTRNNGSSIVKEWLIACRHP